jgi:2-polyprenyl-6-methoxyphenol hydroxylase-like FAD-dependent oxidoreductase
MTDRNDFYDVVIVGAGLAGLALARQLLLQTDKTVLLLDKHPDPPRRPQKVGESLVQLSGYYFSKVLDLEEHLLINQYLKYNLRFQWKTPGLANTSIEEYSASYARVLSNIPTFQLDRNLLESHLLEVNVANPRLSFRGGISDVDVKLSENGDDHQVSVEGQAVHCRWVIDASGRAGFLKRRMSLDAPSPIRHGAVWCWVDGLVNYEKLTDRSPSEIRVHPRRRRHGHFPQYLATTHFCGEGRWFWVIPLHGKTSLGLVYDRSVMQSGDVRNARTMLEYVCREWPVFARDLPKRTVVAESRFVDYAYDVKHTISRERWALTGIAGRFSDPLYSPGSDLIAIANTLIVDAVTTDEAGELEGKCRLYDAIARAMYQAYVPSYAVSYDCLGDQEAFTLKYSWELAVYFGFYVMPFINDLFTNTTFMRAYLMRFARLGRINENLQRFLSGFYQWKRDRPAAATEPCDIEFYRVGWLGESEKLFYEVARSAEEADRLLDTHFDRMAEFARYILAHVHAVVVNDRRALVNAPFVSNLALHDTVFDPERMRAAYARYAGASETYQWGVDPWALEAFLPSDVAESAPAI